MGRKSQSEHQDFRCDHYETDKTGRKNSQDVECLADWSLFRKQFGGLKLFRVPGYAQFCTNSKTRKNITFRKGLKKAMT